jgi:hypothetical protein
MRARLASVLPHGIVAGMIGYTVIVVAYAGVNVAQGRSAFHTAARLGEFLVNAPAGSPVVANSAPIIAFNGIHLVAALLAGYILNWLMSEWESNPGAGYFFFFVLTGGLIMGSFLSAVILVELVAVVGWTQVLVVNMIAAAAMVAYVLTAHPELRRQLPKIVA